MTIKAIDTTYRGYRFRSRAEARWAIFLDHAGIKWEYEPQGYVLDGEPYLPDFLLYPGTPGQTWLEIKAKFPDAAEIRKAQALARETGIRTYLYFGPCEQSGPGITDAVTDWDKYFEGWVPETFWSNEHGWLVHAGSAYVWQMKLQPTAFRFDTDPQRIDRAPKSNFWWWTDCGHCGQVILKLTGDVGWCPTIPEPDDGTLPAELGGGPHFGHETDRLQRAYRAARSARFEHGETPEAPPEPEAPADPVRGTPELRERLAEILEARAAATEGGEPA
jgi:hypothetical protein